MEWNIGKKYTATLKISTEEGDDEGNTWRATEEWPLLTEVDAATMLDLLEVTGHGLAQIGDRLDKRADAARDHLRDELEKLINLFN